LTSDIDEGLILIESRDVCTELRMKESALRKYALILQARRGWERGYLEKTLYSLEAFYGDKTEQRYDARNKRQKQ